LNIHTRTIMSDLKIEKDIFPGLMQPPFHYACFTRFNGYSEERFFTVHNSFQIILGLSGTLHFELESAKDIIDNTPGNVSVLGPGIKHRWYSEENKSCENFMFFCDGFSGSGPGHENIFNLNHPEMTWNFQLEPEEYQFYIANFRRLINQHNRYNAGIMHGLLYAFCGVLCRKAETVYGSLDNKELHPALRKAIDFIRREYRGKITLGQLSRKCGLGPSRLSELFRHSFGLSPLQYVDDLKIKKADQLLNSSDMNISQIAEYLGFSSVHYFSRFYKKHTGTPPSASSLKKS